jgi:hypothetical protein
MIRHTLSSPRFRTVSAAALALAVTFSAGTVFGARSAEDPFLMDAKGLLNAALVDLEIASGGAASERAQREFDRHIGRATKAIQNAIDSIDDASAVAP